MSRKPLTVSERFYRRALYACSTLLSLTIISALLYLGYSEYSQFHEKKASIFVAKRDNFKSEADRLTNSVTQFSGMFRRLLSLPALNSNDVQANWPRLPPANTVELTPENWTVTPFTLITGHKDTQCASNLPLLLRQASVLPLLNPDTSGILLNGIIYTADHNFLAITPQLDTAENALVTQLGMQQFIETIAQQIDHAIDQEITKAAETQGSSCSCMIWLNPASASPIVRDAVAAMAVRLFLDSNHMVTIVFLIPRDQFLHFFMKDEDTQGLFVLDSKNDNKVIDVSHSPKDLQLLTQLEKNTEQITHANSQISNFYKDGIFYITQKINGPDWNVVYALDWADVINGLDGDFTTGALWMLFSLALIWLATFYFDRFVISSLQRKALALIEVERFSQLIIDTLPIGIAVHACSTDELILQNTVATQMMAHASRPIELFYREIVEKCQVSSAVSGNDAKDPLIEVELPLQDGTINYIGVTWEKTRFSGQNVILLGFINLNMHKAHEALMLEAKTLADRANHAKSMFLAQISHEIRTPLHGAMGHMELLSREDLTYDQHKRVNLIRHAFDMLMGLVNDILDITKLESNAIRLNSTQINVNDLLEACAQLFSPLALGKGLKFYCLPDPALELPLVGDPQRLMQILQNLVGNAIKFTEQGDISLSVTLIHHEDDKVLVCFEVSDTGIGISPHALERIFESLEQADDTISSRFGGTGLGLSLCRRLVQLMDGTITVSSEVGRGSQFKVELQLQVAQVQQAITDTPLAGKLVHLCCNRPDLRSRLAAYLAMWGARCTRSGDNALQPPDLRLVTQDYETAWEVAYARDASVRTITILYDRAEELESDRRDCNVSAFDRQSWRHALSGERVQAVPEPDHNTHQVDAENQLNILVAEDDHINRILIAQQLLELGYTSVRLTKNGHQALSQWQQLKPDVLITDLGMPKLNGICLAKQIRDNDPDAYIIATTAANTILNDSDLNIFTDVVYKPANMRDLQRILANVRPDTSRQHPLPIPLPSDTFEKALIDAFIMSWPAEKQKLQNTFETPDHDKLVKILHRLQGGMLALGQSALASESLALQVAITGGNQNIAPRCNQWITSVDEFIAHHKGNRG